MARKKISEFTETLSPALSGITYIVDGEVDYFATLQTLMSTIVENIEHTFTGNQEIDGNLTVSGTIQVDGHILGQAIEVTYDELVDLISTSGLTTGSLYKLTDFQTVHYMIDYNTRTDDINIGEIEPLFLTANSSCTLMPECYSETFHNDLIRYDWNPNNWLLDIAFANAEDAVGSGTTIDTSAVNIITGFKGVIYYREDLKQNNQLGYDFRNAKFRRWKLNYNDWNSVTTYNSGNIVKIDNDGAYISLVSGNTNNNVTDTEYWGKIIDYTISEYWANSSSKTSDDSDYVDLLTFAENSGTTVYNLCVKNNFFESVYERADSKFGLVGSILPNNVFYLSNDMNKYIVDNKIDIFFELNTIGYNFEFNDTKHFFFDNIIGSDFSLNETDQTFQENIIYDSYIDNKIGAYFMNNVISTFFYGNTIGNYYTFNICGINCFENIISDQFGSNYLKNNFYRNKINSFFVQNKISSNFSDNIVGGSYLNVIGLAFNYNIIGDNFYYNTIGNYFIENSTDNWFNGNTIGNNFKNNNISDNFRSNVVGNSCSGNTIASYCKTNTIGTGFNNNDIGPSFNTNTIGNSFNGNTIQSQFNHNTIGNAFYYNAIEGDFDSNIIGNNFMGNHIGIRFYNNTIGDYFNLNNAGSNVMNLTIPTYGSVSGNTCTLNFFRNGFDGTGIDFSSATHIYGDYNCDLRKTTTGTFKIQYIDGDSNAIKIGDSNE